MALMTGLEVIMPANIKPVLSILVDADKRRKFSKLCKINGLSMGKVVNAFIDKCLEYDSINCLQSPLASEESAGITELREMFISIMDRLTTVRGQTMPQPSDYTPHNSQSQTILQPPVKVADTHSQQQIREEIRGLRRSNGGLRFKGAEKRFTAAFAEHGMEDDDPPPPDFW